MTPSPRCPPAAAAHSPLARLPPTIASPTLRRRVEAGHTMVALKMMIPQWTDPSEPILWAQNLSSFEVGRTGKTTVSAGGDLGVDVASESMADLLVILWM